MSTEAPQRAPGVPPLEESGEVLFPSWEYRPLRPGPGHSREEVATDQRSRLQRAVMELVAEDGYQSLTVRSLARRAQISSGAFYRHYRSTDDCLLSTYHLVCRHEAERMMEAGLVGRNPRERLTFAIERFFLDVAAAPEVARFALRAAPASGPVFTGTFRSSAMQVGGPLEYCLRFGDGPGLPRPLLEGVVTGLARIGRLQEPSTDGDQIRKVASEAASWVLNVCRAPVREELLISISVAPGRGNGRPARRRMPEDVWTAAPGDDRGMILSAAFRVAKTGYHHLTVSSICREAGVTRRSFSRYFQDLEECFSSALEQRVTHLVGAWRRRNRTAASTWNGTVQRALEMIAGTIDGDLEGGRTLLVEIFAAGTQGIESRDRLIAEIGRAVRVTAPADQRPTDLEAEASTTAAWTILAVRLAKPAASPGQIASPSKR